MPEIIGEDSSGAKKRLETVITKEELQNAEAIVVKRLASVVKVPGFRPGKVPAKIIRAQFKDLLDKETLDLAVQKKVQEELRSVGAKPLGEVEITDMQAQEDGSVRVVLEFESAPEVRLPDLSRVEVEKRVLTVSDVDVIEQLEAIQESLATVQTVDRGIREGDQVVAEMTEYDPNGDVTFTGKVGIHYTRDELDPYLYDELAGKKGGDECEISVVAENDKGEQEERKQHYKVLEVKEIKMPELDDDFARAQGYDTIEDMKEKIKQALEQRVERELDNQFEHKLVDAVFEAAPFDIPRVLVQRRYEDIKDLVEITDPQGNPAPPEQAKAEIMKFAEFLVKRDLILAAVVRDFNIQATEEDIKKQIESEAESKGVPPEKHEKKIRSNPKEMDRIKYVATMKKAMDFLKDRVQVHITFQ